VRVDADPSPVHDFRTRLLEHERVDHATSEERVVCHAAAQARDRACDRGAGTGGRPHIEDAESLAQPEVGFEAQRLPHMHSTQLPVQQAEVTLGFPDGFADVRDARSAHRYVDRLAEWPWRHTWNRPLLHRTVSHPSSAPAPPSARDGTTISADSASTLQGISAGSRRECGWIVSSV